MNSRLFSTLAGLGLLLAASPSQAENEIGFIERFALAADREKVLGELVPGTEDYYFYHALHYQNTRNKAKLAELLTQWQKRLPDDTSRRGIIENRESLLTYDADPQATLEHLKRMMGVEFNHEQVVRDKKPDLPTALDAKRIDRSVFLADSLRNNERLEGLTIEALEALVRDRAKLSVQQRRAVLSKLQRPDVPGLVELIITELRNQEAHSFGEFAIHRALLPEQLDQLLQAVPELVNSEAFVYTRVRKLAPGAEVNLEYDTAEREAWLTRVWAYAKSLPPAFNSLKAQVLYLRLDHDRRAGVYDSGVFLEYLRLPRSFGYVNERLLEQAARAQAPISDLNADLSHALLSYRPIGEDEALVRDYFLHLFASGEANVATAIKPYTALVRDSWLKPVFAEAMITSGQGDPERWASLLSPSDFQRLKDRVDIEFPPTNAPFFASSEEAQFDVIVKNTPKLLVKIYELNTLNFFLTQKRQLNTDLNLDGLVANSEQTRTFETGPFKRERFTFKLADFKFAEPASKRGAWVVEFIGGGRSSRALVRAGQWQVLQQTGPAGDLLLVVDEKGDPVKDSVAWLDGRKYTLDEKLGRIVVPYTNQPGMKALVLADAAGTFATLTQFDHHGEDYRLDTQFHIEREQLLARRQATLAVRTALMLGETHLAPELLSEPKLTITSTTHDGISTTREVKDLKLSAGSVLTHSLVVPERLATLTVVLTAKVEVLSGGGEKRDLSAAHTWQLNGIDKTDAVHDGHLSLFDGQRVYELLGKNGEPVPDQQVIFTFKHRDFNRTQTVALRTDDKGRVGLGTLAGIASLTARAPNGRQGSWSLEDSLITHASVVHVQEGEALRVPVSVAQVNVTNASLLELHAGTFTADHSAQLVLRDGFLMADALKAGDYSLRLPMENREVAIKVTAGKRVGGWYLGKHRNLEAKGDRTLQIINLDTSDKDKVSVNLANATAFTRVHIAASRFEPGRGLFGGLGQFARFGAASGNPAKLPVLYSAGREIGDEYRYILERRYAKPYPGNMLTRPGLLLNPWEVRSTDLEELRQSAGEGAGATQGGSAAAMSRAKAEIPASAPPSSGAAGANLDFLADSAPVIYNLIPDKDGVVWFERKALGDRQHLQVYAEDLDNAVWKVLSFPEANTKLADQRLARNLDPVKPFTQKKEITVLAAGKTLTLAEILTSEMESYDTLGGIYSLFTTLTNDATLAKFDWLLKWPLLKEDEKRAKYSEFACHELNLFVARKDKAFFDAVVKPYLANKKDKTFMDHYLLATDLTRYLEPWAYGRLNAVERCLLAQRIEGEAPNAARHLRELWELEPPDPEADDRRFETALRGRAMELADESSLSRAKKDHDVRTTGNKAMPEMAPAPVMAPAAAGGPAPVDFLSGSGVSSLGMSLKRSMTADEGESLVRLESEAKQNMPAQKPQEMALLEVAAGRVMVLSGGALHLGDNAVGDRLGYFGSVVTKSGRATVRAYFRQLGSTKEWAENNYYQHRITEQNEKLVPVNAFWRDYAAWIAEGAKGPFVSANVAEATHNHTEMLMALAVLDLPFEAPKHITKAEGGRFDFTAAGPVIVYHKEIKTAAAADAKLAQLLVSQSFFRHTDRFEERGNEKFEKYVTEEFLTGEVYGANIVVTNPSSSPAKAEVLLQIPQGALPVLNSKATDSRQVRLEPYTTQTFEYRFYFPAVSAKAGVKFPHFPVNVAIAGTNAGSAKPFEFNVVARFTQVDKASWEYVSQDGTEAEVLAYLGSNNVERVDLSKVAWRCRRSVDFYRKLTAVLRSRHVWDDTIASYALLHNDTGTVGEWLKHHGEFTTLCGPYLASQLITLDPVERHDFEHLEYSPLINQRAHRVGNEWRIANPALLEQYLSLAGTLAFKPRLDDADNMSVVYYLFLQDRVEEALARFASINPNALPTKIQYDYIRCYAAFYEGNLAEARSIATARANEPVVRWKSLFADVLSQLDEIDGKPAKSEKGDKPDREKETADLAATEPALDLKVENRTITLTWKNVGDVTLNYYLMDPEFSFSSSPFVSQDASRFSIIRPNKTAVQSLPAGKDSIEVPLPAEFAKANVLVEAVSAGLRKTQAYHANTLKLTVTENYGRLEARDSVGGKPVGKAYVKVYARLKNGTLRFFKDGYTDLRGRFDYASLNGPEGHVQPPPTPYEPAPANGLDYQMLKPVELNSIDKLAVLVLSDTNGTMVKEVNPPQQ